MRLLVRALIVVSSVAVVVLAWRYLRPDAPSAVHRPAVPQKEPVHDPIDPRALPGTYQGPIQRADGTEEWLVLEITRVVLDASGEVTFDFTLSSIDHTVRDQGRASLRDRWIRFGGLSGEVRRRDDGALFLRSVPIAGPPNWLLERPRSGERRS